ANRAEAERVQRAGDGLALRIEHALLQRDGDSRLHNPRAFVLFRTHQYGTGARSDRAIDVQTKPPRHLLVGLNQAPHVAAEAVLVELVLRFDVPQPRAIWRNFVGENHAHRLVLPQPAELAFEIHELDSDAEKESRQEVVDPERERHDVVDLLRRGPTEGGDVLLGHHWVSELVVLVIELEDRAGQGGALVEAEARGERACGHVAHHDLKRDDLDLADQLLAHVEALDEVGRHADLAELLEEIFGDAVVEDALALDLVM